jgi:hypothetical protein
MKWLVVLVALGAAFLGYRAYDASASSVNRYEEFAEEILNRHYDDAASMSEGLSKEDLEKSGTMEKIGAGPTMFQTVFPSNFEVKSRQTDADGSVHLKVVQTVLWNPTGVESVMRPAMSAKMDQTATLRKVGGEWRVVAFKNDFVSMGETKKP